jgi:RNA polymerase sigma-70 factor (ECF subfamily)
VWHVRPRDIEGRLMDDSELIALCRTGDQQAFAELAGRYRTNAWHVCLSITGNHYDAEDALQDALTAAWQNLPKFRGDARFNTWLHRIAANAALGVVRRRKQVDTLDLGDDDGVIRLESTAPRIDETVAIVDAVRAALMRLSDDFRVAIVLAEYAQLPYADIAEHQGISVATVKTRIHRARKQLAEMLKSVAY